MRASRNPRAASPLNEVTDIFDAVNSNYKRGTESLISVGDVGTSALKLLAMDGTQTVRQGSVEFQGASKIYEVKKYGPNTSRPIRTDLFISDPDEFHDLWAEIVGAIDSANHRLVHARVDHALYTCAISFACAYDLYKPKSRKTPGTFFEIMVGSLLKWVTLLPRGYQIDIPGSDYKVTTDIFLKGPSGGPSLVVPTKITSRERIVQAYAHQRILDDIFGRGQFRSIFVACSELQRDEDSGVNEICVPGQVKLFHKHLSPLYGMYYLDPPVPYMRPEFTADVPVYSLSALLSDHLPRLLEP